MKKLTKGRLKSIAFLTFLIFLLFSAQKPRTPKAPFYLKQSNRDKPIRTLLNINNISSWIRNDGQSAHSPDNNSGAFYPRGTAAVIYQDGVLWGGVHPTHPPIRVGGQTYRIGTVPGRIISEGNPQNPDDHDVRIYRIRRDYETVSDEELRIDAAELWYMGDSTQVRQSDIEAVRAQYRTDWNEWPVAYGAPFYDLNNNGIYEPSLGEEPGLAKADQVVWFVANDLDSSFSTWLHGSPPMGLELQVTMWGYKNGNYSLNQALFRRYRIINKSSFVMDSMFISQWSDPDVGVYTDDLVGCDTSLQLGFAYSGHQTDGDFAAFGLYPSAVGYCLLQGPIMPEPGNLALFNFNEKIDFINLRVTAFGYYAAGSAISDPDLGEYDETLRTYNMINGFTPTVDTLNPTPFFAGSGPMKGLPTKFPLSGDPVTGYGDVDNMGDNLPPGDRRMIMPSGPFTLLPGDTQEVIFALVGGAGASAYPYCVENLKINVRAIRHGFPNFPSVGNIPPSPQLSGYSSEGQIILEWGSNPELLKEIESDDSTDNCYFEGYNLWQLPDIDSPPEEAIRIGTFDKETYPGTIIGYQPDSETGILLKRPVILGENKGVQHFAIVVEDKFAKQPLIDGKEYHFGVSAYRYIADPAHPFPVLESDFDRVSVRAHVSNPGYQNQIGDELPVTHVGGASGKVSAMVVDPGALTGHEYRINFDDSSRWSVTDLSLNKIKIAGRTNMSGNMDYPIIDGIMPRVEGVKITDITGWSSDGVRWISGVDLGGRQFFGGLDLGENFYFGSNLDRDDLVPVRLEFQDEGDINNNGFISKGAVYRRDQNYGYAGTGQLPFAAYDIFDAEHPRRVNICFVEDDTLTDANLLWDLGWSDSSQTFADSGGHEYIFIMNSDYDEGISYSESYFGPGADVLFVIWSRQRGTGSYLSAEFTFDIEVEYRHTPADFYTYVAPAPSDIPNRFRVYQNYSNPFNAGTTFRYWIPRQAKVKLEVFSILGQRVATLVDGEQDQGEYFVQWQPQDVASGMYIYRLSAGDHIENKKLLLMK